MEMLFENCLDSESSMVKGVYVMNHSYVICINNKDYPASLELRKVYEVMEDQEAQAQGLIRIIDESGEDYLYPQGHFMQIDLPQAVRNVISKAS